MQDHCLLNGPACPSAHIEMVSNMAFDSNDPTREWDNFEEQNSEEHVTFDKLPTGTREDADDVRHGGVVPVGLSEKSSTSRTEHNSWGDFEGFTESMANAESFNDTLGMLVQLPARKNLQKVAHFSETCCTTSDGLDFPECTELKRNTTATDSGAEVCSNYEDIFKFRFPDVPVQQSSENIISLNRLLETSSEEKGVELTKAQLSVDSVNIWRTIHGAAAESGLRRPLNESHCLKSLVLALGIDTDQKNILDSADHLVGKTDLKDIEEPTEVDGFGKNGSPTLIQTKLSVSPDAKHGRFFTYQLFLKKLPLDRKASSITFPGKNIFAAQNLKMKT